MVQCFRENFNFNIVNRQSKILRETLSKQMHMCENSWQVSLLANHSSQVNLVYEVILMVIPFFLTFRYIMIVKGSMTNNSQVRWQGVGGHAEKQHHSCGS